MSIIDTLRRSFQSRKPYHPESVPERYSVYLSGPDIFRMLYKAAQRACWDISQYRKAGLLKDRELSLSFLGFTLWYVRSLNAHAKSDNSTLQYPSDPARFEAIRVMAYAADRPDINAELQRTFHFDATAELQWAVQKANNPTWKECLTRGVIMGCRSMAYSVATASGYNAMPADLTGDGLALGVAIENVPPNAVIAAASVWLDQTFDRSLSKQLLSLDRITGGAPAPLEYLTR